MQLRLLSCNSTISHSTSQFISYTYPRDTRSVDRPLFWDIAIQFTRWQHPAIGCGARYAVPAPLLFKFTFD